MHARQAMILGAAIALIAGCSHNMNNKHAMNNKHPTTRPMARAPKQNAPTQNASSESRATN